MAELDRVNSRRGSPKGGSPRSPKSPTLEQLIHTIETSKWSKNAALSSSSLSPRSLRKVQEPEAENGNHKRSLFTKMKETAKKLQQNLSPKKKHSEEGFTPAWGVKSEDNESVDEKDPEYLGAPMYESKMAPQELKETARQHPRAYPVISEKHALRVPPTRKVVEEEKDEPKNAVKKTTPNVAVPEKVETYSEKAQEKPLRVSDATPAVTSKFQGLTVSAPAAQETTFKPDHHEPETLNQLRGQDSAWDKGVSVKEYIMQKLEPGEDEKALSQVITEAISPRKASNNGGVVERVKGAVSSFIWTDDSKHLGTARPVEQTPAAEEENHGRVLQTN